MFVEAGCNLNAEDIGHVPMNHAIFSGSVAMVEALLSHNVALCLPELLQDAVVMCQTRERELNSYRTSGVPPAHLLDRIKREMHSAGGVGGGIHSDGTSSPGSYRFPPASPGSFKPGSVVLGSPNSASSTTGVPSTSSDPPTNAGINYANLLREELDNRIAIVLMLLNAHIRIPYNTKPAWLPYLRSHVSFKHHLDAMSRDAAHTFDRLRAAEFANMTRVELIGQCIDDEKAAFIARHLIGMTGAALPLLHLNLSRNWIEQRGATEIGNALGRNTTLLSLNLAHNYIQDCTHMMKGMKDNKTLKALDLSANRLSTGEPIAARLPTMRLTSLNLAMNKLEYRGGSQILKAVLGHANLALQQELDPLAFNSSGRSFLLSGTDQARNSSGSPQSSGSPSSSNQPARRSSSGSLEIDNTPLSTLTSLNLASNEIHPYDRLLFSDELVEGLKNNTSLTELDLSFNWLGNQDLSRIIGSLAHNVTLAHLSLRGYAVPESDLKMWLTVLSLNHSLTDFHFDHSPPSDTRDAIRRHVAKNNIAFSNSPLVHDSLVQDTLPDLPETSSPSSRKEKPPTSYSSQVHDSAVSSKQYGIVRCGDSPLDELDEQSIPKFETSTRGPAAARSSIPSAPAANATSSNASGTAGSPSKSTPIASPASTSEKPGPSYGDPIEVHAQGRELFYFPRSVLQFSEITKLVLQRNNLASVPRAINLLINLSVLDLRRNRLAAVPPELGDLTKLSHLLLSHNKLQFIPVQLTKQPSLKYVMLDSNPLSLVPPNFRKGIEQIWKKPFQQSEFFQYLKTIGRSGEGTFNKGRLMLVGDPAVGKTTIRKMLVRGKVGFSLLDWFGRSSSTPAAEISVATDGIDIDVVKMSDPSDGTKYQWDVWDYAGHEVYYTTHTFFLSPRAVYLLVFNMEQYSRLSIEYWMQSIVFKAGTQAPIFLVGTHPERLTIEERTSLLAQLKSNYRGIFVDLVWINAVTGEGVEELKGKICKIAAKRRLVGETVPVSYMRIADQLRATAQARPYMPMKELAGIVLSNDVASENVDAAVSWLIDVGAVLSYATSNRNAPEQLVFIDPQFLCNMFAQVVSIKYSSTTGRLSRGIIASICRHDSKLQEELFHILTVFDLAYVLKRASSNTISSTPSLPPSSALPTSSSEDNAANTTSTPSAQFDADVELFVPALLSLTEPKNLAEIWRPSSSMRTYERHFTFPFLPLGFFSKLLVRCLLLPGVEAQTYWANGIVAVQTKHGLTLASLPTSIASSDTPLSNAASEATATVESAPGSREYELSDLTTAPKKEEMSDVEDEMFYLRFEPEKNLLIMKVSADQDGVTLASLVDLVLALIQERYPQAEFSMTIPVPTSADEIVYLEVDELASNIATGQYVKVIDGKVWDISMFAPDLVLKDLSNLRVNDADIVKGRRLGVGSFGEVFEAHYHGEQCAVKYITRFRQLANQSDFFRTRSSDFANFAHEIRIMNLLKHPNIVRMKGFIPQPVGLLMEFFSSGDLVGLLERSPNTPWPLRMRIALDVALGMNYLHMLEPPLCHRDLRSPNILLKSTQADSPDPVAKVADFGLTVAVVDRLGYGPTESWRWSAPEVVTAEQYTHRSDIWSYGILILELIFAELPYNTLQKSMGKREDEMSRLYTQGGFRPEFPDSYDSHPVPPVNEKEHTALKMLSQLGRACCMEKPEDRLPFTQIVFRLIEIIDSMGTFELPEAVRKTAMSDYYLDDDVAEDLEDDEDCGIENQNSDSSQAQPSSPETSSSSLNIPSKQSSADVSLNASTSLDTGLRKSITFSPPSPSSSAGTIIFAPDNSKEFILADRKSPKTIPTTAIKVSKNNLWVGLADGSLHCWDLSSILIALGEAIPNGTTIEGNQVRITSTAKPLQNHSSSIQAIVENDTSTKICAISEDGWFAIVDLKNGTTSKFQAVPGHLAPLLCALSIGERIYIGNARGHVVAWSWESPALMAFWDGMDAQPVCQLFYSRGTKDLVVTYGSSIKFLNVFDLGDTLRHWKPQSSSIDPSKGKVILARSRSANAGDYEVHIAVEEHRKLAASAHGPPSNDPLFRSVAAFQHAAYIGFAGQYIWTKSGPHVRLWTTSRSKSNTSSGNIFAASSSSSSLNNSFSNSNSADKISGGAESSSSEAPRAVGTSRSSPFSSSLSLHKELRSPNAPTPEDLFITPSILSMPINSQLHRRAAHVFIHESPHCITQWDSHPASFVSTLRMHDLNLNVEHLAILGDTLIAVARDHILVWRSSLGTPSTPPVSLTSSSAINSSLESVKLATTEE